MDIILRKWKSSLVQYKSPRTPTKYARYIPSKKTRVKYKVDTTKWSYPPTELKNDNEKVISIEVILPLTTWTFYFGLEPSYFSRINYTFLYDINYYALSG
jgi:hypothetical protein